MKTQRFVVQPPRMLGETEGEYLARRDLERVRDRFRGLEDGREGAE